jgi:hypothetical protein
MTGEPVDSTFLPQNIAAAQMTFLRGKPPAVPNQTVSKTKSHLSKMSQAYATGSQAAAARTKGGF